MSKKYKKLSDKSASGRERPWRKHKLANVTTVDLLHKINHSKKARNISDCGDVLEYDECPNKHWKKLRKAYFCKDRVCSLCNWRKSLFTFAQFLLVAHKVLADHPNVQFVFLTLTVKNCELEDLSDAIKHYLQSYRRFLFYKRVKAAFKGTFRSLEVTYNPLTNTFHPHLHCVAAVNKHYFSSRDYIKHSELKALCKRAFKIDYTPNCYIEKIKPRNKRLNTIQEDIDLMDKTLIENALVAGGAEVAKYSVKVADITNPVIKPDDSKEMVRAKIALRENPDWQGEVLRHLINGIKGHRLIGYTGIFKEAHMALKCDDVESSDLISMPGESKECTCPVCQSELTQMQYLWNGDNYIEKEIQGDFAPRYYKRKSPMEAIEKRIKNQQPTTTKRRQAS